MRATIILFVALLQAMCYMACSKSNPGTSQPPVSAVPPVRPPIQTTITAPIVNAGPDFLITLPTGQVQLLGSFSDRENNIKEVSWAKISGPDSHTFEDKHLATTWIQNLKQGEYQFELTVTDATGRSDKDTSKVTVRNIQNPTADLVFSNHEWIPIWYNSLQVLDIYKYIRPGTPMKVLVQRGNSSDWHEAFYISNSQKGSYEYFIETRSDGGGMYSFGSLYVFYYGEDVSDKPNVKIVL